MDNSLSIWLQRREPADAVARSAGLTRIIAGALAAHDTVHVLDLATGRGSNVRYLAPRLPARQRWLVVDRDAALHAALGEQMSSWASDRCFGIDAVGVNECVIRGEKLECRVETRRMNLHSPDADSFAGRQIVTASALSALTSEAWLRWVAARCRASGAAALFTITYNGTITCLPEDPEDELVRHLLNRHQKTDKGLGGRAAGPDAAECVARCFADTGYRVWVEPSDWILGPAESEIQRLLVHGWAAAAVEVAPDAAFTIARWRARRIAHVDAGRSQIVVGHSAVAACPPLD